MTAPESTEAKAAAAIAEAKSLSERMAELIEWLRTHHLDGTPK